eukprot:5998621-Amphidinium_carterae.1
MSASVTAAASAAADAGGDALAASPADSSAGGGAPAGAEACEAISVGTGDAGGVPDPMPLAFLAEGSSSPTMS